MLVRICLLWLSLGFVCSGYYLVLSSGLVIFRIPLFRELQFLHVRKLLQRNISLQNYCGSLRRRPCDTRKKVRWYFSRVYSSKCAVFWVLCCGMTCKQGDFPNIDVYFYWLAQIVEKYNRLVTARTVKTATPRKRRHCLWLSLFLIVFFLYACATTIWAIQQLFHYK